MMQRVEQHIIRHGHPDWEKLDKAAFLSKNLYNATLYELRQHFFATHETLPSKFLHRKMQTNSDYCALPRKVSQWVVKQVLGDWWNAWKALAAYKVNPKNFTGRPKLPRYKDKITGRNLLIYTNQALSKTELRKGLIKPSQLDLSIKSQQQNPDQVRIVPHHSHYTIEVVYTLPDVEPSPHSQRIAAIDIGLNNLAIVTTNQPDIRPLLVNGRPLKSVNQAYNQSLANLKSLLPEGQFSSRKIENITFKRNQRVTNYLHRASKLIIDYLQDTSIGVLVIGKNDGWKQGIDLGKHNNQNFVQIPHARFIDLLTYKAQALGIQVILTEESYTSKCSFIDNEAVQKHESYQGKRIHRGLFRSSDGRLINADVNGAYNIMRKVFPKVSADGIGAAVVQPKRITPPNR